MKELKHNGSVIQSISDDWQTQARGSNSNEYEIYLSFAGDKNGIDPATGKPLKTFEEWIRMDGFLMAENKSHVEPCRSCKWEIPPGYLSIRGYCARCENDAYNQKRMRPNNWR